jgi:hypothetical protein
VFNIPSHNYYEHIDLLLKSNPDLSPKKIGVLLTADSLYKEIPSDLLQFRRLYAHLDPNVIFNKSDRTTFQEIASLKEPVSEIKQKLNSYINIKFNDIEHHKSYDENMKRFREFSVAASEIIEDSLKIAAFPLDIIKVLAEKDEVKNCYDFYKMLELYKNNHEPRIMYEIMRKLGLILLIARINRSFYISELDQRMEDVAEAFYNGLKKEDAKINALYFWLNAQDKVLFWTENNSELNLNYKQSMEERQRLALKTYSLQKYECLPFKTFNGNEIMCMTLRNKLKKDNMISYTSIVEKIIRKNLEYPSLVRDIIGLRILVKTENDIEPVINEIESILGGSSTRKQEKNSYHKFGKKLLGRYSSKDYFVWKAIYNITLPHPVIEDIRKMIKHSENNSEVKEFLNMHLDYYISNPQDFLVEVQLQDINSYIQSIAKGSPTEHALLKMNQVRSNSFYKIFPQEIYEKEIFDLKIKILNSGSSGKSIKYD